MGTDLVSEGVILNKCEPNYNVWFHDGESIELSSDLSVMKRSVEAYEGKEGFDRYLNFMREAHKHYEVSVMEVLHGNFPSIFSMMRLKFLMAALFALHPFESIYSRASRYFKTDRLRRLFTFGSMYMGMSPFEAPGTYSLLQYTEQAEGIWYPTGGFHRVPDAIHKIGRRLGINYRLQTSVKSIDTDASNSKISGVTLENGEKLSAGLVVCNADLVYAYNNLLPPSSYATSLSKREASCSSISFYWALDRQITQLHTHNIFLARDYKESFDSIFKHQTLPDEPSFYVNVPSRVDPSAAPAGRDSVVVLCPVGHLNPPHGANTDWDAVVSRARSAVINTVNKRLGIDLRAHILHEQVNTPRSWESAFNLDRGAILGLSHSFFNVLCFRPKTRHASIGGLYFAGASTHPGTGVPIVLAGSKITAEQILADQGVARPWPKFDQREYGGGAMGSRVSKPGSLDREKMHPPLSYSLVLSLVGTLALGLALMFVDWQYVNAFAEAKMPDLVYLRVVEPVLDLLNRVKQVPALAKEL